MAAGSFVLIKQGDTYRLLYSARNFTTGLADVKATPYNPAGAAQAQTAAFTELGTSGIYYLDWDSTGKTLGTWTFLIDSTSKTSAAYTRIQVVDGSTLDDTDLEEMMTKVLAIDTNVTSIKGEVESVDHGLDVIKEAIDALTSQVNGIQNNTLTSVAIPESMLIPGAGSTAYKVYVNTYDSSGAMEDPDDQDPNGSKEAYVSVSVVNASGTDRSAGLSGLNTSTFESKKWLTRAEQGRFSFIYTVANTDAEEELIFSFGYEEGGTPQVDRAVAKAKADITENHYFMFFYDDAAPTKKQYNVWYNKGTGSQPSVSPEAGYTSYYIEVDISTDTTADEVATRTRSAINGVSGIEVSAGGSAANVDITQLASYETKNIMAGDSGLTVSTPTEGAQGNYRITDRAVRTVSSLSDVSAQLDTIEGKVDAVELHAHATDDTVNSVTYGNSALKGLIDAIQGDIDNGTSGLVAIKNAIDGNYNLLTNGTYGLSALKTLIDSVVSYVDGVESDLTAIKGSGWDTPNNLHNIYENTLKGGIAL